jgi:hypothetical protein
MGNIATSTATTRKLPMPDHGSINRHPSGDLYAFMRSATNTYGMYRSTDNGSSWSLMQSFTKSNLIEWSSVVADALGSMYIAYRVSDSSTDRLFFRRFAVGAWEAEVQVTGINGSGDPNGGTPGGFWQGVDLAVKRNNNGTIYVVIFGAVVYSASKYGVACAAVTLGGGTTQVTNGIISGYRAWLHTGSSPGRSSVSVDIQHGGDGFSASNPHIWVTWGRLKRYLTKLSWNGGGWTASSSIITVRSTIPASDYAPGQWDGSRFLMAATSTTDGSVVEVYERNSSNTSTTVRTTPAHPQGVVRSYTISYDNGTKNTRVYAVGTSNSTLYAVDYVRATGIWGSWIQVSADTITSTSPAAVDEFGLRRAGTSGSARYDVAYTNGSSSPWTVKSLQQTASYAPNTPEWNTSGQPYNNGAAADVATSLTLDWTFSDIDPTDTQASYALRRQIGVGSFQYWNAGSSSWGGSEVFNSSSTTAVTLSSGWGSDGDANHQFSVKVRDSGSLDSAYSAALAITPSAKVNPTITAPTASQVINATNVTVAWTVAAQKQFRVELVTNPGAVSTFDSGWISDPSALSYDIPYEFANGTGWTVRLTTTNSEGLASTTQTRNFTISYVAPPGPTLAITPSTAAGQISVAVTNPAAVGSQPDVSSVSILRRAGEYPALNANSDFVGATTSFFGVGGTLTYSTTQAHSGAGSGRLVPSGVAADSYVESLQVDIDPTRQYLTEGWLRPDTANEGLMLQLVWYTSGGVFISSTQRAITPVVAGAWMYVSVFGTPPATAAKASVALGLNGTPAAGDAFYVDEMRLRVYEAASITPVATLLPSGATFGDWRVPARTPVEYQAIVYGANGAQIASSWTA